MQLNHTVLHVARAETTPAIFVVFSGNTLPLLSVPQMRPTGEQRARAPSSVQRIQAKLKGFTQRLKARVEKVMHAL